MLNQIKIVIKYANLRRRMMNEPYNYTEKEVAHTVWRLMQMDRVLLEAFVDWYENGVYPQLSFAGVSFEDIEHNKGLNMFNTFLMMNLLKRDPDECKYLLRGNCANLETIDPQQMRPELRTYVEQETARQKAEKKEITFDDRDEFVIEQGKGLTFKLHDKKEK